MVHVTRKKFKIKKRIEAYISSYFEIRLLLVNDPKDKNKALCEGQAILLIKNQ